MQYQRLRDYIRVTSEAVELCKDCEGEGSIPVEVGIVWLQLCESERLCKPGVGLCSRCGRWTLPLLIRSQKRSDGLDYDKRGDHVDVQLPPVLAGPQIKQWLTHHDSCIVHQANQIPVHLIIATKAARPPTTANQSTTFAEGKMT